MDGLKRYVNDDRFRVDGDKNMRLLAFAFTIVFVGTGPKLYLQKFIKLTPGPKFYAYTVKTTSALGNSNSEGKRKTVRVSGEFETVI